MVIDDNLTPLSKDELGIKLSRMVSPDAPKKLLKALAKGMAPGLTPEEIIKSLYQIYLTIDEFHEIALETLKKLPENMLISIFSKPLPENVLYLGGLIFSSDEIRVPIVRNHATPNFAFVKIAKICNSKISQIIADNEKRLIEEPSIIEALYLNKATPMSIASRIIELAARHNLQLSLSAYNEMVKALDMDPDVEEDALDAEFQSAELDQKFIMAEEEVISDEDDATDDESDDGEEKTKKKKKLILSQLPISAKIRLAQLGNRFHRARLIRDSNKVVSMAAIKSPSITDVEIDEYSKNRQISEDIIRYIGRRKDWLKSYRIKVNLVNNPKTPITLALTLINFLRANDLRVLARSRNIAQVIRQAAAQRLKKRK